MEDKILTDSVRSWIYLYFLITTPPSKTVIPSLENEVGSTIFTHQRQGIV